MRARGILAVVALIAALGGCSRKKWGGEPVDPALVAIGHDALVIRTGTVGLGQWRREASFVLVPARNLSDRDLLVTLRGDLVVGGARHAVLPESLRVPAGGERTFALVDAAQIARPGATAEVVVSGALTVDYAAPVTVTDGNVHQDQGRAVVAGTVANGGRTEVKATVMAAFYGSDGRPLQRPFTVVKIAGGAATSVQLVGPVGSTTAQLYVGEVQY